MTVEDDLDNSQLTTGRADFKGWQLAGLGFIPTGFLGFFGFNPILAQTTNLGFLKMRHKG
jgi:hypothetical protein